MGEKGFESRGGGRIPAISGAPPVRWPESSGDLRKGKAFAPSSVSPFSHVCPALLYLKCVSRSPWLSLLAI